LVLGFKWKFNILPKMGKNFLYKVTCPINQLYLESGHVPARFAIKKARLLFLKNILEEKEDSTIRKFLMLQFEQPSKGDWLPLAHKI